MYYKMSLCPHILKYHCFQVFLLSQMMSFQVIIVILLYSCTINSLCRHKLRFVKNISVDVVKKTFSCVYLWTWIEIAILDQKVPLQIAMQYEILYSTPPMEYKTALILYSMGGWNIKSHIDRLSIKELLTPKTSLLGSRSI